MENTETGMKTIGKRKGRDVEDDKKHKDREYDDKKHGEEIAYYTKSNKQLKTQLEAFLAPAKK